MEQIKKEYESVRVEKAVADRVREAAQFTRQTIGGYFSFAAEEKLNFNGPLGRITWEAEEYGCAMMFLDDLKVPRSDGDNGYSLVGRIKKLMELIEGGGMP